MAESPQPITARATAGRFSVVAEARPIQYVWNFGDGSDRVTTDSGRPWTPDRPGSIDHVYEASGRYELMVEVVWEARWRLGSGAWRHLGYFTNSDSRPYRVRSIVSILVRAR
ncbi:MAG TPA: PKD domain-containing protein [Actinomycetota bacterium]|nr:PKD domain-containing protein [Actinomycetota bacterium]